MAKLWIHRTAKRIHEKNGAFSFTEGYVSRAVFFEDVPRNVPTLWMALSLLFTQIRNLSQILSINRFRQRGNALFPFCVMAIIAEIDGACG
jgi:hypothetical protein